MDAKQPTGAIEQFRYDDAIVRLFLGATLIWGLVAMLVGVILAFQLVLPSVTQALVGQGAPEWLTNTLQSLYSTEWIAFGRLRPLHTNAAIFAFAGNSIFAAVYYSTQRVCKTRMYSDLLSRLHFWGWQLIIVSAALTLPFGITQSREYAELEWPIDLAIAIVWVGFFGVNFFGTLARRRERHIYVAVWFYIATIITVAMLHVFNNLWIPVSVAEFFQTGHLASKENILKSYTVYAGVQDAFMQWWYGHNAVAFFLTTPFLGLMYYFLPKAAERPVFSYRLSIVHFWSLVFIYIWAGPHHLHYTALPEWASSLGMIFSIMLWMPSWGGMINGLLTLRGAWQKVAQDPILKFFVVGVTFYGMSTFEGPLLSIRVVNMLSHYTDWTIAHVHDGTLGWNGFMTFGMIYWLAPRLFQTKLHSVKLATLHFWIGTVGILLYAISMYTSGITQGLMWRAFDQTGQLAYPEFIETVTMLIPFYWIRAIGGVLYLTGMILCFWNIFQTWRARPATYEVPVHSAPALTPLVEDEPEPHSRLEANVSFGHKGDIALQGAWHRVWERKPFKFSVWVLIAVGSASLFEIIPTFLIKSNVPTIASVRPYTPLELYGRDIYIANGCYNCHSQMIRPIFAETKRYGEYSKAGEFVYDHPFQWGSRRIGPDLAREGGIRSNNWHAIHFENPAELNPGSVMPIYKWLFDAPIDFAAIQPRVRVMAMLGVPYGDAVNNAEEQARAQAREIADAIETESEGRYVAEDIADKKLVALIAYLQRMGTDIYATPPEDKPAAEGAADAASPPAEAPAEEPTP